MPELPEVETVRTGLEKMVLGKTITEVLVTYPRMVLTGVEPLCDVLVGQEIMDITRRGKYLLFYLTDLVLISHLRMEGKYHYFRDSVPMNKHFHAIFTFTDGSHLVYQDVRKFGTFEVLEKDQVEGYFQSKKLGPEPTVRDFHYERFAAQLAQSRKLIKPHLLDQTLVVGLGNIYVDEVLFQAKIHPERRSQSLSETESLALHQAILSVLTLAIEKGGSSIRTYKNALGMDGSMQDYLQIYGKKGQACPRCQTAFIKYALSGRGTHICPSCQVKQ